MGQQIFQVFGHRSNQDFSAALKNRYHKLFGKGLPKAKLQAHLAKLWRTRFPRWKAAGSQSVQAIADRGADLWRLE